MFLAIFVSFSAQAKERIYILAGQSNMMGKGKTHKLPAAYKKTPSNVKFYYQGRPRDLAKYSYFGPEVGFAHAVARAYPHDTHIIIKHVATGSSIQQWLPGSRLYNGLLRQREFIGLSKDAKIEAIIWMQGEKDARNKQRASSYESHLKRFISGLRTNLESPNTLFVMGKINPEDAAFTMTEVVQKAQERVQHSLPNTVLVSTKGLGKIYDHVHYDADGQLELGKRFARAYVNARR
jgi:hypothetical protein